MANWLLIPPEQQITTVEHDFDDGGSGTRYGPPDMKTLNKHVQEMNKENWELTRLQNIGCEWVCIWKKGSNYIRG